MKRLKTIVTLGAALLSGMMFAQAPAFVRGADVSWCTEMEASGKRFYNAAGEQTEMMTLLRQCGLEAVRLRVWVNPETAYGKWSDKSDVLAISSPIPADRASLQHGRHSAPAPLSKL